MSREREKRESVWVRGATRGDTTAVLELARQAELLETGIVEGIEGFIVAQQDDKVVGSAGLELYGYDGLLRTVVVAKTHRDAGVGRSLVEAAVSEARKLELRTVYLLTTTAPAFFTRLGFEVTARESAPPDIRESWEFKSGCPETAQFMRRAISVFGLSSA
jgi:amino-acid N-acetyltransferase